MKIVISLLLALSFSSAYAHIQCKAGDTDLVKWATDKKAQAEANFNNGSGTSVDVNETDVFLLEAKLCTKQIEHDEYCQNALTSATKAFNLMDSGFKSGYYKLTDVIRMKTKVAEIESDCQGIVITKF